MKNREKRLRLDSAASFKYGGDSISASGVVVLANVPSNFDSP